MFTHLKTAIYSAISLLVYGGTGGLGASQQTLEAQSCVRGNAAAGGIMKDDAACLEVKISALERGAASLQAMWWLCVLQVRMQTTASSQPAAPLTSCPSGPPRTSGATSLSSLGAASMSSLIPRCRAIQTPSWLPLLPAPGQQPCARTSAWPNLTFRDNCLICPAAYHSLQRCASVPCEHPFARHHA